MIKCIIGVLENGDRRLLHTVPAGFDTQAWVIARAESLNLLSIVRIVEQTVVNTQQINNPTVA